MRRLSAIVLAATLSSCAGLEDRLENRSEQARVLSETATHYQKKVSQLKKDVSKMFETELNLATHLASCGAVSSNWTSKLRVRGYKAEKVNSYSAYAGYHGFTIVHIEGGAPIIVDGTYQQFLAEGGCNSHLPSLLFVGTIGELKELFRKNKRDFTFYFGCNIREQEGVKRIDDELAIKFVDEVYAQ